MSKFAISVVIMFVLMNAFGFAVHNVLLLGDYLALPTLVRPRSEASSYLLFIMLAHLLVALGVTWIYSKGREDKPWLGQGARFGLAVALIATPVYLIYHAVTPVPLTVALKQVVGDGLMFVIMGVALAWINRGPVSRAA